MKQLQDGVVVASDMKEQVEMLEQWLSLLTPSEKTIVVMQLERSVGPVMLQLLLSVGCLPLSVLFSFGSSSRCRI